MTTVIDRLDLGQLADGEVHHAWLELVHDSAGRPVRLPVLAAKGVKPGPTFGLTAALHGNELNGIQLIHRLFSQLDATKMRGNIVAIAVVNLPGFLLRQRGFWGGQDLNHQFPGAADGNDAQVYVHRLLDRAIRRVDVLIDLHTASFGRVNSLYVRADMRSAATARMAYLQRPQIIVHNQPSDGTLRGAAEDLGIPAITVEIGNPHRFHRDFVRQSLIGVRAVLGHYGMLRVRPVVPGEPPVLCSRSFWTYTDRGGLLEVHPKVTERVAAGERIATLNDLFGDEVATYDAPEDGVIVGHGVDPVASTGARIAHIGIPAKDDGEFLTAEEC